MTELHITRGLPGSGKTSFALTWVAEDPAKRLRLNRDEFRTMVHDSYRGEHTESATTLAQYAAVRAGLRAGRDVIVDDTNLNPKTVKKLFKLAEQSGAGVVVHDFVLPTQTCIDRDQLRDADGERSVGSDVIAKMYGRYLKPNGGNFPPLPTARQAVEIEPYLPDFTKPSAIIVDMDGTLALNNGHRSFYDYTKVGGDDLNYAIAELVSQLATENQILIVSGREDSCRGATMDWLYENAVTFDRLPFMRKTGDNRDDAIVKLELFNLYIRENYNVRLVLDDRDRVVAMWRQLGLTTLQVNDGDF